MNVVGAALYMGKRVLVSSDNPQALQAFVGKLPKQLRSLCIDLSNSDEGDAISLHKHLQNMVRELKRIRCNKETHLDWVQVST